MNLEVQSSENIQTIVSNDKKEKMAQQPLNIDQLYQQQKAFFYAGKTRPIATRKAVLKKLKKLVTEQEQRIFDAIAADFSKPEAESFVSETGYIIGEIDQALREIDYWVKPERVESSMLTFPSKSYIYKEPYGITLVIAPWNYPFNLAIAPLIAAVAAGNTVILKPSELSPNTSALIADLINSNFEQEYLYAIEGGVEVTQKLLAQKNDYIFFTGSPQVGKIVMKAAAEHLTPVTLELGGKSPVIVDETAAINLAAKRIVFGKCFNAGQTCIAPDYLLVHSSKKQELITVLQKQLDQQYGKDRKASADFARIINEKHFNRLIAYLNDGEVVIGGEIDASERYIAPSVIEVKDLESSIMQEEIFGPILPLVTYNTLDEVVEIIRNREKPLAFYHFTKSTKNREYLLKQIQFGGGTINDTIEHFVNPALPFGGIGPSGIGAYHGQFGFETFSHKKAVLKKSSWIDLPLKYPPYGAKLKWLRRAFKLMG